MEQILVKVEEAAEMLALSRSVLYRDLIRTGELPVIRVGRAARIPVRAIVEWAERKAAEATSD